MLNYWTGSADHSKKFISVLDNASTYGQFVVRHSLLVWYFLRVRRQTSHRYPVQAAERNENCGLLFRSLTGLTYVAGTS